MKTLLKIVGIYAFMAFAVSCSSSEDNTSPTETQEPNTEELAGNWTAEKAVFEIDFDGTIEVAETMNLPMT